MHDVFIFFSSSQVMWFAYSRWQCYFLLLLLLLLSGENVIFSFLCAIWFCCWYYDMIIFSTTISTHQCLWDRFSFHLLTLTLFDGFFSFSPSYCAVSLECMRRIEEIPKLKLWMKTKNFCFFFMTTMSVVLVGVMSIDDDDHRLILDVSNCVITLIHLFSCEYMRL